MKVYTIIAGVNGTGKSSLTGVLRTQTTELGQVINVDEIMAIGKLSPIVGGKIALSKIQESIRLGISFTQETTLSGKQPEKTAALARENGYTVRLYYVGLNTVEECLVRIENRVKHGGHDIPEADVKRRFSKRWEGVSGVLPYCEEARFFDNDNGFQEVAEYKNGVLILKGDSHPDWILELSEYLKRPL